MLCLVWRGILTFDQRSGRVFFLKLQAGRRAVKARALPARNVGPEAGVSVRRGRGEPETGSNRQRPAEPAALRAPHLPADGMPEQIGQLREEGSRTGMQASAALAVLIGLANRVVPAEGDLVDVALQEWVAELVKDADLSPLHLTAEGLRGIAVDLRFAHAALAGVLPGAVLDGIVSAEALAHRADRLVLVAHQMGRRIDRRGDNRLDVGARFARDDRGPDLTTTLDRDQQHRLVRTPARRVIDMALEFRGAADRLGVDLDHPAECRVVFLAVVHQFTQGVLHLPGGRLADAEPARQHRRGDALAAGQDQVERHDPGDQGQSGGVQRRSGSDGELTVAVGALVQPGSRGPPFGAEPPDVERTAERAEGTARPDQRFQEAACRVGVAEAGGDIEDARDVAQGVDRLVVHRHAPSAAPDGRVAGAYAGCGLSSIYILMLAIRDLKFTGTRPWPQQ